MKIAIYSPYLDTLGGGEKYMMTIAESLSDNSSVDVLLDENLEIVGSSYLKSALSKRFSLNLTKVNFIKAPIGKNSTFIKRSFFIKGYDLLFYLTDGSIFYPTAKKNILHIQSPIIGQPATSAWGKMKLKGWDLIIYNSNFTKKNSQNNWPIKSDVLYPPVDVEKIAPLEKKKYILSVGRFFGFLRDKKHKVLIDAFKKIHKNKEMADWSLHLAGSAGEGDKKYIDELKEYAQHMPVKFYPNISYTDLVKLYGQSSIYWHAAGFEESDPTKMEHFGISTVEAMAAGCVPVVIAKGGQVEIVDNGVSGYVWTFLDELQELTVNLASNSNLRDNISKEATDRSKVFSKEKFTRNLIDLVSSLS